MQILLRSALLFIFTATFSIMFIITPIKAEAMAEILPLDKIEAGMKGVAYTVVDNSGIIKSFNVEIIGLMDNGKGSSKMLMAKASGDVVDKVGGVLQGMSGSPVYVNGKLIGALAAGLKEMSPYTFFITPIESMLPMWSMPDPKAANKYQQVDLKSPSTATDKPEDENKEDETTEEATETEDKTESKAEEEVTENITDITEPVTTTETGDTESKTTTSTMSGIDSKLPLSFEGFNNQGNQRFALFSDRLKMNFLAPVGDAESSIKYDATLEPGSPVGVAVVYGDFSIGATGTITAVEGKKILAFGHPFSHVGNVNFFMTEAEVVGSISGELGAGVKIANIGSIIGRINQDREAGVAGILGSFPSVVPITVKVNDPTLGKTETYNSSIAYNEEWIAPLGATIAYAALSKTADSLSGSTVDIDFKIKTNAVKSGKVERRNMFYNSSDVGQVAVVELLQTLNLVCSNTTEESNIFGIDVDMTLDSDRRTASIVSAVPDKSKVKPGETVNLTVTLQPYRKGTEKVIVPYKVPITMKEGPMTLDIHGGALVSLAQALANAGLLTGDPKEAAKTYEERLNELVNTSKNNQLVVEPGAVTEPKSSNATLHVPERYRKN